MIVWRSALYSRDESGSSSWFELLVVLVFLVITLVEEIFLGMKVIFLRNVRIVGEQRGVVVGSTPLRVELHAVCEHRLEPRRCTAKCGDHVVERGCFE